MKKSFFPLVKRDYLSKLSAMNSELYGQIGSLCEDSDVQEARQFAADELIIKSIKHSISIHKFTTEAEHEERQRMVLDIFQEREKQIMMLDSAEELQKLALSMYQLPFGEFNEECPYHSYKEEWILWKFRRYPAHICYNGGQQRYTMICERLGKPVATLTGLKTSRKQKEEYNNGNKD